MPSWLADGRRESEAPGGAKAPRGAKEAGVKVGCIVAAVLALIVLILVGAAGGFWYYTTTPTYSVKQIESALRDHDAERFETYVDLDAVLGSAFDQLMTAESTGGTGGAWDSVGRVLGAALLKPQLVAKFRRQILDDITAGRTPAGATISSRPVLAGIDHVRRDGALARVGLKVQDGARAYVLDVRLRQRGSHWQAIEIVNLAEIVQEYKRTSR